MRFTWRIAWVVLVLALFFGSSGAFAALGECMVTHYACNTNEDCTGECELSHFSCRLNTDCVGRCVGNQLGCNEHSDCLGHCLLTMTGCFNDSQCVGQGNLCVDNICIGATCLNRICVLKASNNSPWATTAVMFTLGLSGVYAIRRFRRT